MSIAKHLVFNMLQENTYTCTYCGALVSGTHTAAAPYWYPSLKNKFIFCSRTRHDEEME